MSYAVYDQDGYVGDVASVGGWTDFVEWASGRGDVLEELAEMGTVDDPEALARAAESAKPPLRVASTVTGIAALARRAVGVFIVSDGVGLDEDESPPET